LICFLLSSIPASVAPIFDSLSFYTKLLLPIYEKMGPTRGEYSM